MIHSKGKLLLRFAALIVLLIATMGVSVVLVVHAQGGTGTITVTKQTVPPGGTDFEFTDDILPSGPFLFDLDDDEQRIFSNVPNGAYTITETNPAVMPGGWILTSVVCKDENEITWGDEQMATATVYISTTRQAVECIFTNERPPAVGGYVIPVNKLGLLMPWIGLAALASLAVLTVALVGRLRG
jgi:hypothetical protein